MTKKEIATLEKIAKHLMPILPSGQIDPYQTGALAGEAKGFKLLLQVKEALGGLRECEEFRGNEVVSVSHAGISEVVSVSDTYNLGTIWRKSRVFLRFLSLRDILRQKSSSTTKGSAY